MTDGSKVGTANPVVPLKSDNKVVTITVNDANDNPFFLSPWTVEVLENSRSVVDSTLSVTLSFWLLCILP